MPESTEESDIKLSDGEKDGKESLELPALKPDLVDRAGGPGNGCAKRELPSEIPDTDAPEPFSSQVNVVALLEMAEGGALAASMEENSEACSHSPIEDSVHLESSTLGEVDILAIEDSLPSEKTSFLQMALRADEALSIQEISTTPQKISSPMPSINGQRTEIPASDDDEDATDEDKDPSATIYEFRATHGSASEDLDTFFMSVPNVKQREESDLPSSSAEAQPRIIDVANAWKDTTGELADGAPPSIDASEVTTTSISELPQPKDYQQAPVSKSMEVDDPEPSPAEWNFSSLIELPNSSINLQDPSTTTQELPSEAVDVELPDALPLIREPDDPTEVPMSSIDRSLSSITPASMVTSADPPHAKTTSTQTRPEGSPETTAASKASVEQSIRDPPSTDEIQVSVVSSLQQNEDDTQANEVLPSRHMPQENTIVAAKHKTTPRTSFATPEEPLKEEANGECRALSTATNQSQNQTTGLSSPNKTDARKGSMGPPESPNKDVLFEELKAMKIASIQSRNASLEAEIAAKRTKLEEVTKELKRPAAETVKRHIKLLHDYNDIRDVGQGLVGMIADNRGVRIGELYDEFGVGLTD